MKSNEFLKLPLHGVDAKINAKIRNNFQNYLCSTELCLTKTEYFKKDWKYRNMSNLRNTAHFTTIKEAHFMEHLCCKMVNMHNIIFTSYNRDNS